MNQEAAQIAIDSLKYAQNSISGKSVGACVVARNPVTGDTKLFDGCNLEFAVSLCVHAERVALVKAISEGYVDIQEVYVTSLSEAQMAALCGTCRQDFLYVNPNTMIFVLQPDGTLKLNVRLIDTMNYPYLSGPSKIKPKP